VEKRGKRKLTKVTQNAETRAECRAMIAAIDHLFAVIRERRAIERGQALQ
jgi:hypothetical protein